ncbi:HlyD family efflux transporter periplasmic adaptor subunit [Photobacterium damselae subsp. damselae]|uniref:HlyD family secretion protein n=1 Tax=Photobacterium damselae TaxID=38293 RepID=UPI00159362B8|nr:HlyD family efflux transporter periplasmic adaptor subunit [Photobacterium damselae]NVH51376.1 HlyD family efflux transporter periplasmic adaptor subunit [Photobacterium damselae subsp. damselae]NVO82354.1 HlyD family efflux transporter periplasmic adaptor subunit [Photobacterium damselae subsp. damselae]
MYKNLAFILSISILVSLTGCNDSTSHQALGTLERDTVRLTATSNEIIRQMPIQEGQKVKAGDLLVQLDDQMQKAALEKARAEQGKAKAYLQRLLNGERPEDIATAQAHLAKSQANLQDAKQNFQRVAKLVKRKVMTQADLDNAQAQLSAAIADVTANQETLDKLVQGTRIEDIAQAEQALKASQAEVALQQQKLSDLTVVATRDGILDSLPYHVGSRVPLNGVVAIVEANSAPYAQVYIPEPYRVHLKAGDKLTVHVDGLKTPFQGTLRWIATESTFTPYYALNAEDRARLVYLAKIDLPADAVDLPSGVPAQVDMPHE